MCSVEQHQDENSRVLSAFDCQGGYDYEIRKRLPSISVLLVS